jgi:lipopolysaccharide transport system ATP-binding protein
MTVRLAFAVAAFLEPEILVIDEVLAVGDAEFQKKAIGKMQDISRGQGRTVLFVSHNMAAIQKLCTKCILLQNGKFVVQGKTENIIQYYLEQSQENKAEYFFNTDISKSKKVYATRLRIEDLEGRLMNEIPVGKAWKIKVDFTINEKINNLILGIGITDVHDYPIATTWSLPQNLEIGHYTVVFTEKLINYNTGNYKIVVGLSEGLQSIDYIDNHVAILFSNVVDKQDDSVVNNKSGLLNNQMGVEITKNK